MTRNPNSIRGMISKYREKSISGLKIAWLGPLRKTLIIDKQWFSYLFMIFMILYLNFREPYFMTSNGTINAYGLTLLDSLASGVTWKGYSHFYEASFPDQGNSFWKNPIKPKEKSICITYWTHVEPQMSIWVSSIRPNT